MGVETHRNIVCSKYTPVSVGKSHHKADLLTAGVVFVVLVFCIKIDKWSQFKARVLLQLQNTVLTASWKAGYFLIIRSDS